MDQNTITLQNLDKGHIFYLNKNVEEYIDKLVTYILTGIQKGEHVFLIENDRIFPLVMEKVELKLNPEQISKIHHINNFDYYFSSGSFNPPYIFSYLNNILDYYMKNKLPFRIWAHVEWADDKEVQKILVEFEKEADGIIQDNNLLLICAYEEERMPNFLKDELITCHEFIMTESQIVSSTKYVKKEC